MCQYHMPENLKYFQQKELYKTYSLCRICLHCAFSFPQKSGATFTKLWYRTSHNFSCKRRLGRTAIRQCQLKEMSRKLKLWSFLKMALRFVWNMSEKCIVRVEKSWTAYSVWVEHGWKNIQLGQNILVGEKLRV